MPATYIGAMIIENGYTLMGGGGSAMSAWKEAPTTRRRSVRPRGAAVHANPRPPRCGTVDATHRTGNPSSNAVAA